MWALCRSSSTKQHSAQNAGEGVDIGDVLQQMEKGITYAIDSVAGPAERVSGEMQSKNLRMWALCRSCSTKQHSAQNGGEGVEIRNVLEAMQKGITYAIDGVARPRPRERVTGGNALRDSVVMLQVPLLDTPQFEHHFKMPEHHFDGEGGCTDVLLLTQAPGDLARGLVGGNGNYGQVRIALLVQLRNKTVNVRTESTSCTSAKQKKRTRADQCIDFYKKERREVCLHV